ncbi:hypothetical protein FOA52_011298 [Chlamydomonas sp. UWO 241]|nr:hypothetical protein FOA52_011298 [Chlamydomonas sp. UWO 241]
MGSQGEDWVELGDEDEDGAAATSLEAQLDSVEVQLASVESEVARLLSRKRALQSQRDHLLQALQQEALAPRKDWALASFEWDGKVQQLLTTTFKLPGFRPLQREVINATLQGRDVLCLMPSGGGKSLCYQLPALVKDAGVTLVVSPLLSLIADQVLGLSALGIPAAALTSHTPKDEATATLRALGEPAGSISSGDGGGARLVYVTPEKVVASKRLMAKLEKLYQAGRFARIVVDEAHCVSALGNDFRPDYKKLGVLRQQFPNVPIIALTATATHRVCGDVLDMLRIRGAEQFRHSVNRPNLFYEVCQREGGDLVSQAAGIAAWVSQHFGAASSSSGIVYCLTRKDCEALARELTDAGLPARFYHADMEPGSRESAHHEWSAGRVQVMVATIAFGMGINKPDVRFVGGKV